MKRVLRSLALVAIAIVSFSAAKAQNPHFVDLDKTGFTVSGKVAGLGNNVGITIIVKATVSYDFDCTNPSGRAVKPFTDIIKNHEESEEKFSNKNGMVPFSLTIKPMSASELAAEYCPNSHWKVVNLTPSVLSASIEVKDNSGTILFQNL